MHIFHLSVFFCAAAAAAALSPLLDALELDPVRVELEGAHTSLIGHRFRAAHLRHVMVRHTRWRVGVMNPTWQRRAVI